ncbi:MAG: ABC transporter permease subunit [Lentisphaerae bacterium]|nr:ABC transporter permease subunit [Lentisphaerota bacterium]
MLRFVISRLLQAIPVLLAVVTLTFFLIRLAPGGPFTSEKSYSPEALARLNAHYGLDDPLLVQYAHYIGRAARGDLGPSLKYTNRTVNAIIADAFPVSLELGMWALLFALAVGIPAGVIAALRSHTALDHVPMALAMTGICLPSFVLGPLLTLGLALGLGWFNAAGWDTPSDRVLPAVTLGAAYAAYLARLTRGSMLDVLPLDYIRTARAKGASPWRIVTRHALRNALLPVVSFLGPAAAGLITGSFVVETVFHIPGLGTMFVTGAFNRDYTLVLGLVVFYGALVVLFNAIVDLLLAVLDPRTRKGLA